MPNAKGNSRRGANEAEKSRRGRLSERSFSFHGRGPMPIARELPRPKTLPELPSSGTSLSLSLSPKPTLPPKLTKLLLNVTIQGSCGAVQVVMHPESTVGDLISAAVRQYQKEARRPFLSSPDPSRFDLHYSQFSLESLERDEKLMALGSRNFFLCPKKAPAEGGVAATSCSKEVEGVGKKGFPWLRFMDSLF